MLKDALATLMRGEDLSRAQMRRAIGHIIDGQVSQAQMAALLVALRLKGETAEEIAGAAEAMRQRMTAVPVARQPLLDTCGTGGDGAHTFNLSTATAFVVAACGVPVAKHGNRAVSSSTGCADVLQACGVNIEAPVSVVADCIGQLGIGFLFAPALHPAMAHAAPVRRELGMRTLFNVLGPLTNPAGATYQLLGVFERALVPVMAEALALLGSARAWVVHSNDGLDELSVCDVSTVAQWDGRDITTFEVSPEEAGLPRAPRGALVGGDARQNATLMRQILAGEHDGPLRDAVALNAGAALVVAGAAADLRKGVTRAGNVLQSGQPAALLSDLCARTRA